MAQLKTSPRILVVDDKADIRLSLRFLLNNHSFDVVEADSLSRATECLETQTIDAVLLDMNYQFDTTSGQEGLNFIEARKSLATPPIIAMTAWSRVELAVAAMQAGAVDFFAKPWNNQTVIDTINKHLKQTPSTNSPNSQSNPSETRVTQGDDLLWTSPAMQALRNTIEKVAKADVNVLLRGENGTGKTHIANYIHQHSQRGGKFVSVNMAAIPETLFESELFGHKKGAFTDAKQDREGRFSTAKNGTLLLDEIGSLPLPLQAKLLRVLESNEYEVIGDSTTHQTQCRIISATNTPLDAAIDDGEFRSDLYFRLNTIELVIPPLRKRIEDILPLARHFLAQHCAKYQQSTLSFSQQAELALQDYHWPGNIRELNHLIARAVLMCEGDTIAATDLYFSEQNTSETPDIPLMTLAMAEKKLLLMAMQQSHHKVEDAAALLGISRSAIYRRLEKYNVSTK